MTKTKKQKTTISIKQVIITILIIVTATGIILYKIKQNPASPQNPTQNTLAKISIPPYVPPPTPIIKQSTAVPNWKEYKNNYYQISFPETYTIDNEGMGLIAVTSPINPSRSGGYELENGELKIEISTQPYTKTLADFIASIRVGIDTAPGTTFKKTTLNGIPAEYSISHASSGAEIYYLLYNNRLFSIAKYPFITSRQEEYNHIISTFKPLP